MRYVTFLRCSCNGIFELNVSSWIFTFLRKMQRSLHRTHLTLLPCRDVGGEDIEFQLLDLDYVKGKGASLSDDFMMDAFGVTQQGNSVHMTLTGFKPFFFVNSPKELSEEECREFVRRLNHHVRMQNTQKSNNTNSNNELLHKDAPDLILSAKSVKRKSIWGFRKSDSDFLQIFCRNPEGVRRAAMTLRNWDASFEMPACFGSGPFRFGIYEANVDPITRLSTSTNIVISGWVRVHGGDYDPSASKKNSWCDIDVTCDLQCLEPVPEKDNVAPFLIGSFDIECVPEGGRGFPDPTKPLDRCVQIGTTVYKFGQTEPCLNVVLALDTVDDIEGVIVRHYATEEELLLAWRDLVRSSQSLCKGSVCIEHLP